MRWLSWEKMWATDWLRGEELSRFTREVARKSVRLRCFGGEKSGAPTNENVGKTRLNSWRLTQIVSPPVCLSDRVAVERRVLFCNSVWLGLVGLRCGLEPIVQSIQKHLEDIVNDCRPLVADVRFERAAAKPHH